MSLEQFRAVVLHGAGDLRVESRTPPPLEEGRVRVRFGAGGICGSDLHYFRHGKTGSFTVTEPLILGHEIAGEVVEVAEPADGLRVGDRVAVNPARYCGHCGFCTQGRLNLCENVFFMGSASRTPHMQGGFAETIDVAPSQCFQVPARVPFAHAALAEPLAVCLHAVERAGDLSGRSVLVMGAGPIGLLVLLLCRQKGARATAVADIAAAPPAAAARLGADHAVDVSAGPEPLRRLLEGGPDIVFEASGSPQALGTAIEVVRRGGTVVQIGNLAAGPLPIPANAIMSKELDVLGAFRFGDEFGRAVDLIVDGKIDVGSLITAEMPMAQAPEAFALAADRGQSIKVVLQA